MHRALNRCLIFICLTVNASGGEETVAPRDGVAVRAPASAPAVGAATVTHAGGAVSLVMPAEWSVLELPLDRQVRLVMSPDAIADGARFVSGIWLSLYYHENLEPLSDQQLIARAQSRLQSRYRQVEVIGQPTLDRLGADVMARVDYQAQPAPAEDLLRQRGGKPTEAREPSPTAESEEVSESPRVGFYLLVRMDWGLCEICAVTPVSRRHELADFERIISGIQLSQPAPFDWRPIPSTRDAIPVMGSWKAFKSRLRIHADGQITILTDTPFTYTAEGDDRPRTGNEISGNYTARDDLIFVSWHDGSKLNYRWRLLDNKLLLTDHEGRTTQLLRILE